MKRYLFGFSASVGLTLLAYWLAVDQVLNRTGLIICVITLALVQFVVQMVLFLHLDQESKPRWKLLIFGFMCLVVLTLVIGSLWIMSNLNYHTMHEHSRDLPNYLHTHEGF